MVNNKKCVIVLSGGMDSTTLLHYVNNKTNMIIYPIAFMYGQKHHKEIECAKWQVQNVAKKDQVMKLKIIDLSALKEITKGASALTDNNIKVPTIKEVIGQPQPISYVPFRNTIFLTLALSYAESVGADIVYYGAQKHDEYSGYWDTTTTFVDKINEVSSLNRLHKIVVKAPFVNLSKSEEIIIGDKFKVNYAKTLTCYKGNNCGVCPTCADRIMAFAKVGKQDTIKYTGYVDWEKVINENKQAFKVRDVTKKIIL